MSQYTVRLEGGAPWGFRISGGQEFEEPIQIARINPNSKAYLQGVEVGDCVSNINGVDVQGSYHSDVQKIIKETSDTLVITLQRNYSNIPSDSEDTEGNKIKTYKPIAFNAKVKTKSAEHSETDTNLADNHYLTSDSVPSYDVDRVDSKEIPDNNNTIGMDSFDSVLIYPPGTPMSQGLMSAATVAHELRMHRRNSSTKDESPLSPRSPDAGYGGDLASPTARKPSKGMAVFMKQQERLNKPTEEHNGGHDEGYISTGFSNSRSIKSPHIHKVPPATLPKPKKGVWSPDQITSSSADSQSTNEKEEQLVIEIPPVWTPGGSMRKEYRQIGFKTTPDSKDSTDVRRGMSSPTNTSSENAEDYSNHNGHSEVSPNTSTYTTATTVPTLNSSASMTSHLPRTQNPTITLLQKSREGQIPKGAVYVGQKDIVEGDVKHTDSYYLLPSTETSVTTVEKKAPKYSGIGPTDGELPVGLRSTIDDKNQKDWYKKMYTSLHKSDKKEDLNTYTPTYVFPEPEQQENRKPQEERGVFERFSNEDSPTRTQEPYRFPTRDKKLSWTPPSARNSVEVYKIQPRSIIDYEPGKCSIAAVENKKEEDSDERSFSTTHVFRADRLGSQTLPLRGKGKLYGESDYIVKRGSSTTPPPGDTSDSKHLYKYIQEGGEIPAQGLRKTAPEKSKDGSESSESSLSPRQHPPIGEVVSEHSVQQPVDRRRRDEADDRRRRIMQNITEEEKRKKVLQEQADIERRRHSDNFTPKMKSPIPSDRFSEAFTFASKPMSPQPRPSTPKSRRQSQSSPLKGKAKALYTFKPQSSKELGFSRGDVIRLSRQIDKNWYEGELHGNIGIFPVNYVEVLTPIETVLSYEGQGRAKYSFTAQTQVEMSVKKGELMVLLRRIDDNWYEAKIGTARHGIVPANYIDVSKEPITPISTPTSVSPSPTSPIRRSPSQLTPPLKNQSTVRSSPPRRSPLGSEHSPGHSKRFFESPQGHQIRQPTYGEERQPSSKDFQSSYKHNFHVTSSPVTQHSPRSQRRDHFETETVDSKVNSVVQHAVPVQINAPPEDKQQVKPYKAVYNYRPQNEDELELKENDMVYVMEKCDDGWFVGTSARTGQFGTFPGNYVQVVCFGTASVPAY